MASPGGVEVAIEPSSDGSATVVRVDGELDMATCSELEHALDRIDLASRVVIDLSGCTFLDSSALRVLVERARAAETAGGAASLVVTNHGIRTMLEIAKIDAVLPVHDTLKSAL